MESLTPPILNMIRSVRWQIGSGLSIGESLRSYLDSTNDPLASRVREMHIQLLKGQPVPTLLKTPWQRAFWELVVRGSKGQPILETLSALEEEVEREAQAELDEHLGTLQFKVMIPMLFFMFPAYLVVLIGPMLRELSHGLGGG